MHRVSACSGPNDFRCDDGECLDVFDYCNGQPQCAGAEDERGCTCAEHTFRCDSGQCIDEDYQCDGVTDCYDLSDETDCGELAYHKLKRNMVNQLCIVLIKGAE